MFCSLLKFAYSICLRVIKFDFSLLFCYNINTYQLKILELFYRKYSGKYYL